MEAQTQARTPRFEMVLTQEERDTIKRAAKNESLSVSAFVRRAAIKAAAAANAATEG